MFIESKAGLIVVAGCSHPGIDEILDKAKIHGHIHLLLGGFHGFKDFDLLQDIDFVCPTHCTKHIKEIAKMYPKKYLEGGAGRVMLLPMNKESYV
jgi:7,8-dihydropterin-6-yl-methyl-4-(beta-D-ribofuranosyl)aminobenzene 5'-phosphate synthase